VVAPFSDPTTITNPWFPISELRSAILNGHVDGKAFYTETTLLPFTRVIEWAPGRCVRVLVSQYMAFLDGRLQETAIDLYAQSDDGSVWYLGEDVFDYDRAGRILTTEGTWHAGTEGPIAMIMPADPQIGDANRPENIPGIVFEEVAISRIEQTVDGPSGPVTGVIVGTETHQDGAHSDKVFAPGYGEFLSRDGGDVEAMALASPTDAIVGPVPPELRWIAEGSDRLFASSLTTEGQWRAADRTMADIRSAWTDLVAGGTVPPRLEGPTRRFVQALAKAVAARDRIRVSMASVDVSYAAVDLQLRFRPPTEIDALRFELWARRVLVDAAAGSLGGARSDLVTMEWIRDRFAHTLDPVTQTRIDTLLGDLGGAVVDRDLDGAAEAARDLIGVV
jgi:hypothetical protein